MTLVINKPDRVIRFWDTDKVPMNEINMVACHHRMQIGSVVVTLAFKSKKTAR